MKKRPHWKKARRDNIHGAVNDPVVYQRLDASGQVLATVTRRGSGWEVAMANGDVAGPYGEIEIAKQSAIERIAINRRALS